MKSITPATPLEINGGEHKFGTPELIRWAIDTWATFNGSGRGVRSALRIDQALAKHAAGGETIDLEESDYELLVKELEEPPSPYPVQPARALVPHIDAIVTAGKAEA